MPEIKLIAEYTFEHSDSAFRPKDMRWGSGTIPITTDHEPVTQEDFDEISRYIAKEVVKDCNRLVLNKVYLDPQFDVIEGTLNDA